MPRDTGHTTQVFSLGKSYPRVLHLSKASWNPHYPPLDVFARCNKDAIDQCMRTLRHCADFLQSWAIFSLRERPIHQRDALFTKWNALFLHGNARANNREPP